MKTIKKVAEVFTGGNEIATTIDNTSTNSQVAGAKAVYDATLDNYSTTEKVVGTWIDGKPLYEKVVTGTISSNSEVQIQMETSITMRKMNGNIKEGTTLQYSVPYYAGSTDFTHIFFSQSSFKLFVKSGTTHGYGTFEIVCQYTKTTD